MPEYHLPSHARSACAAFVVVLAVIVSLLLATRVAFSIPGLPSNARPVVASFLFLVAALPVVLGGRLAVPWQLLRAIALQSALAATFFASATLCLSSSVSLSVLASAFVFVPPAMAEELAFRVLLPGRLQSAIPQDVLTPAHALFAACVVAQATFAVCHLLVWSMYHVPWPPMDAARLFAAGLLYSAVLRMGGLWLAAGTHAALNADLVRLTDVGHRGSTAVEILMFMSVGLVVTWYFTSSPDRRGLATRVSWSPTLGGIE